MNESSGEEEASEEQEARWPGGTRMRLPSSSSVHIQGTDKATVFGATLLRSRTVQNR